MAMVYTDVIATVNTIICLNWRAPGAKIVGPCAVCGKSEETVLASEPSYISLKLEVLGVA